MLKIAINESSSRSVSLRLDGQVSGKWVQLLERVCEVALSHDLRVVIDLKNVSFADRDGIALLRNLRDRKVVMLNTLPFITEQIDQIAI